jgi:carbon-monoxide dehydrogenase small subunit/xanthine dehydrogenase YagT iron-sulfur-binding subunit
MGNDNRSERTSAASIGVSSSDVSRGANISTAGATLVDRPIDSANARDLRSDTVVFGHEGVWLHLTVNGRDCEVRVDPATTLVEVLRDGLGLTGTKIGCDRGACSACTVWLDGEVASSCMTFAFDARGRAITTIEGLAQDGILHPVQQAFVDHDAMQCGFCTPGLVMSCAALVDRNPSCTSEDVKAAVGGHLCRCGTYPNVFKAALAAAGARSRTVGTGDGR